MKRVLYFLEDRAHESFLTALVERVALEEGLRTEPRVLSSTGGAGRVVQELQQYAMDVGRHFEGACWFDVLVVGIDGNCRSRATRVREIDRAVAGSGLEQCVVHCVPDPHIERWYLLDIGALRQATGLEVAVSVPPYKCERSVYKSILVEQLKAVGSLLGGPEYGAEIAGALDFDVVGDRRYGDKGFMSFVDELRRGLTR